MKIDRSERLQSQNGGNIFASITRKRGPSLRLGSNLPWEKWREESGEDRDIFPVFRRKKRRVNKPVSMATNWHSVLSANILPFQQTYCNKNLSIYEDKA